MCTTSNFRTSFFKYSTFLCTFLICISFIIIIVGGGGSGDVGGDVCVQTDNTETTCERFKEYIDRDGKQVD